MVPEVNNTLIRSYSNKMRTKAGQLDLLSSETVLVSLTYPLQIEIEDITLDFLFFAEQEKGMVLESEIVKDGKGLILKLINFNNNLGCGILDPFVIGSAFGRVLYFCFYTNTLDGSVSSGRVFTYNLFLGNTI